MSKTSPLPLGFAILFVAITVAETRAGEIHFAADRGDAEKVAALLQREPTAVNEAGRLHRIVSRGSRRPQRHC